MSTRIFLNELTPTDRQLAEPEAGVWKKDERFLQRYSHDIHVRGDIGDRIVNSVPSVFARPIQFDHALRDLNHPMHTAIRDQWRGLLAMFALRSALTIPLRVTRFTVRDAGDPPAAGSTHADAQFMTILRSQLPNPAAEWESWALLYCDDQLVGATSPWSVVYTPAEYRVKSGVSWFDRSGLLTDPLNVLFDPSGRNEELRILLTWVRLVIAQHPWGLPAMPGSRVGDIQNQLRLWEQDLARKVQPWPDVNRLDTGAFPQVTGAYSWFLSSLPVPPLEGSDFLLAGDFGDDSIVLSRTALRNPALMKRRVSGGLRVEQLDLSDRALPGPAGAPGWRAPGDDVETSPRPDWPVE